MKPCQFLSYTAGDVIATTNDAATGRIRQLKARIVSLPLPTLPASVLRRLAVRAREAPEDGPEEREEDMGVLIRRKFSSSRRQ
jgi:hypothetical protein